MRSGLVKVYALDRQAMIDFYVDLEKANSSLGMCFVPCCAPCMCCYNAQCLRPNVQDKVNATHVALTQDGIKFVVDRHKKGCRMDCEDQGRVSKTVAYGKITDADMEEPAGKSGPCCCMISNVLTHVHVDTASSGGTYVNEHGQTITQHELSIAGLVDPHGFKADVWAMIRGDGVGGVGVREPVAAQPVMERGGGKSVMERMDELTAMRDKGYVTEKEFEEKRKVILASA